MTCSERHAQRVGIGLPHQLPDVLHMPPARFMARDAVREFDRLTQCIRQIDALQLVATQLHQLLAECLQRVHFLLAPSLAGRFGGVQRAVVIGLDHHRGYDTEHFQGYGEGHSAPCGEPLLSPLNRQRSPPA